MIYCIHASANDVEAVVHALDIVAISYSKIIRSSGINFNDGLFSFSLTVFNVLKMKKTES